MQLQGSDGYWRTSKHKAREYTDAKFIYKKVNLPATKNKTIVFYKVLINKNNMFHIKVNTDLKSIQQKNRGIWYSIFDSSRKYSL